MANFYRIGAAGLNWSNVGSWSSTSGGPSNGIAQPTSSDDVIFNASSPTTVTVAGAAAALTLTLNRTSLVITLNGGSLVVSGNTTVTLITVINKTVAETFSTNGIAHNAALSGTVKVILTGGTWSHTGTNAMECNLDLQGDITISGTVRYGNATMTYVSGTITTTGSTLYIRATTLCTLNTDGVVWNNFTLGLNGSSVTLTSNMHCTGLLNVIGSCGVNPSTTETLTIDDGLTLNAALNGSIEVILTGGIWQGTSVLGTIVNLTLAGNVTVSGNVYYGGKTLKRTSGTITVTGATLNLTDTCTLDLNPIVWENVILNSSGSDTYTINSLLSISDTLTLGGNSATIFDGTSGFTCAKLISNGVQSNTYSFKESITYTITELFECYKSRLGSIVLFTSSHASTKANILMPNNGNNSCNILADFRRIDASGGRTIMTYGGTVTDCININSYTDKNVYASSMAA